MVEEDRLEVDRKVTSEILENEYWNENERDEKQRLFRVFCNNKRKRELSKIKDLALGKAEFPRVWDNCNSRGHDLLRREPTSVRSVQKTCLEYKLSNFCCGVIRPPACSGFCSG